MICAILSRDMEQGGLQLMCRVTPWRMIDSTSNTLARRARMCRTAIAAAVVLTLAALVAVVATVENQNLSGTEPGNAVAVKSPVARAEH